MVYRATMFDTHDEKTLLEILRWRRDVRHFRSDPVAPEIMDKLRRALDHAPSVGNSRPWRIVEVADADLRARVAASFAAENAAANDTYDGDKARDYADLKLAGLDQAPVQLAVFTDLAPQAGHGLGRRTMPETLVWSTVMAIYTLWLVARANNIGIGWVSILDPRAIEACLDVPGTWRFTAYLCVGHAQFDDDAPELERRGWQDNTETVWIER